MFAADAPSYAHSLRSKRTRQAAGNDDSVKLPLTKKRRSALRRDTFEPLTDASLNEIAGRDDSAERTNGHAVESTKQLTKTTSHSKELTLRGAKKIEKRTERGGGLLTLSSNEFYNVAQLPSLPDEIRSRPAVPYTCVVSPEYDYILALTHTDALIWPYNSNSSAPSARDLISFKLPFPPSSTTDPLPLAAFTAKSANGEPGIVVVSSKWGKVVYWENITNASSFVPGQATSGVQGTVPGMLSGETIKELVSAEPSGFIITLSHGRVAHLTTRDQMGRPGVGVQFLRKTPSSSLRGGIFGSIRNVFGGDRRRGTLVVRAGKSAKAQRDIVIASEDGELEFWNTNLAIGNSLSKTLNIKEEISNAIQTKIGGAQLGPQSVKVVDFELAVTPASRHELAKRRDNESIPIVVLAALSDDEKTVYFVIETVVAGETININAVHRINCYSAATDELSSWRPRLCLSKVQPIAFVLFGTAVVLMSLARIRESPSSQLLMDRSELPEPFQDSIRFQDDTIYKILGCANEDAENRASCIVSVQGFGIIRISSKLQLDDEMDVEDLEGRVSPKSKIEQAIFYGTNRQNPLELSKPADRHYTPEEIEEAVLEISDEIVNSTSKYLPKAAHSLENQIKMRAKALEDLVHHVLRYYPEAISRQTRFRLLWNAEKLAAAQAIWKVQENIQRTYPRKDDREMTYLNFALRALHETRQKYPNADKGEKDHVRHWLIYSVARVDHLMSELVSSLRELDDMDVKDPRIVCDYYGEAVDLWITTYQTAFKFREDSAVDYGLGDEIYEDGVLKTGYPNGLPHPWTSGEEPFRFGQRLIYDICQFLNDWWEHNPALNTKTKKAKKMPTDLEGNAYEGPSKQALVEVASRLPTEVELFSRITNEENIQAQAKVKQEISDPESQRKAITEIKAEVRPRITQAVQLISRFNMSGAIELAENLRDPGLLVDLNAQYLLNIESEMFAHPDRRSALQQQENEVQKHVETYFDKFGNGWAYAHFSNMVAAGSSGSLLAEAQANNGHKQKYLTWFLRKSSKLGQHVGKISWINDVVGEKNFTRAQRNLEQVANEQETNIWAKKTELCLGKLAGLAAQEASSQGQRVESSIVQEISRKYDDSLALLNIQESVSQHVSTSVSDAIDEKAAHDLAVDIFARRVVDKHPALKKLLTHALGSIINNESLPLISLVDLLTLMDPAEFAGLPDDDPGIQGHEFALALQAIQLTSSSSASGSAVSSSSRNDYDHLRMTAWRRTMIRDDWSLLNDTSGKTDRQVEEEMQMSSLARTLLEVFQAAYEDTDVDNLEIRRAEIKLFTPEEILASASSESGLLTDKLKSQYREQLGLDDKALAAIEKDLNKEQEKLRSYVERAQLEVHFSALVRDVEREVRQYITNKDTGVEDGMNGDESIVEVELNGHGGDNSEILDSIE